MTCFCNLTIFLFSVLYFNIQAYILTHSWHHPERSVVIGGKEKSLSVPRFQFLWEGTKVPFFDHYLGQIWNMLLSAVHFIHFERVKTIILLLIVTIRLVNAELEVQFRVKKCKTVGHVLVVEDKVVVLPVSLVLDTILKFNIKQT